MKLLTASHLFPNPVEPVKGVFVAELVQALSTFVAESRVLAPVSHFPLVRPRSGIPLTLVRDGVPVDHPSYLAMPRAVMAQRWRPYLQAAAKQLRDNGFVPDVIHAHWLYPDALAMARWAAARGIPCVATIHGHAALGLGLNGVPSPRIREALHAMTHLIAVSSELRDILLEEFQVQEDRITVLHNGVDLNKFPRREPEQARRKLGLALNRKIVLCVARLSVEKRIDRLIESVALAKTSNVQVFVIGDGPLRAPLQARIEALALSNRIILLGGIPHDQLVDWFWAADAFCLPSEHEGCPVVVHEALGCGLPVVSTRVGAVPDLVRERENGHLSRFDSTDLAARLDDALARTWNRDAIAAEGAKHSWSAVAERTVHVYGKLLHPVEHSRSG